VIPVSATSGKKRLSFIASDRHQKSSPRNLIVPKPAKGSSSDERSSVISALSGASRVSATSNYHAIPSMQGFTSRRKITEMAELEIENDQREIEFVDWSMDKCEHKLSLDPFNHLAKFR
jgi:hypothetical protein